MEQLRIVDLRLTPAQAKLLQTVVTAASNNDKTYHYTEDAVKELSVVLQQIQGCLAGK